jgi:hypothetical protein
MSMIIEVNTTEAATTTNTAPEADMNNETTTTTAAPKTRKPRKKAAKKTKNQQILENMNKETTEETTEEAPAELAGGVTVTKKAAKKAPRKKAAKKAQKPTDPMANMDPEMVELFKGAPASEADLRTQELRVDALVAMGKIGQAEGATEKKKARQAFGALQTYLAGVAKLERQQAEKVAEEKKRQKGESTDPLAGFDAMGDAILLEAIDTTRRNAGGKVLECLELYAPFILAASERRQEIFEFTGHTFKTRGRNSKAKIASGENKGKTHFQVARAEFAGLDMDGNLTTTLPGYSLNRIYSEQDEALADYTGEKGTIDTMVDLIMDLNGWSGNWNVTNARWKAAEELKTNLINGSIEDVYSPDNQWTPEL